MKKKSKKIKNPMARDLFSKKYRLRVVRDKKRDAKCGYAKHKNKDEKNP